MKTLLVATDFSLPADRALKLAQELAAAHEATLHILHVVEPIGAPEDIEPDDEAFLRDLENKARQQLETRQQAITEISVRCSVVLGHRSEVIRRLADELDAWMVVLGTHAGKEGGISRQVVYRLDRPVLLVP